MTIQEMIDWCRDKQSNRKIILLSEGRELSYIDLGLSVEKKEERKQQDLFENK